MAHHHEEEDWLAEVEHREDDYAVGDEFGALDESDQVMTYRRMEMAAEPWQSRLDSLPVDAFAEAPGKVAFVASTSHDPDADALFPSSMAKSDTKPVPFKVEIVSSAEHKSAPERQSEPVPMAPKVSYLEVNPTFESSESAQTTFDALEKALKQVDDVEFQCVQGWRIDACALVAAEEVFFTVQLYRLAAPRSTLRVDFNLRSGDEMQFLAITDKIRNECKSIDVDMQKIPQLKFDLDEDFEELFPGSLKVDTDALLCVLEDLMADYHSFTRYEIAKQLKNICRYQPNRRAFHNLYKDQLITVLQSMLKDDNEDIIRFAIFTILNFANDGSVGLQSVAFPQLPETLQQILSLSQKPSTLKLAGDLYKTLNEVY